ncbi:unnamed protein product [Gordionus sp. m RMFG-2023]
MCGPNNHPFVMEIDQEIDTKLSFILNSLRTNDKDILLSHFQELTKCTLDKNDAIFWLEMHNWKLQQAIGDFFDNCSGVRLSQLSMKFIQQELSDEEFIVLPSMPFTKNWKILNDGKVSWPINCQLSYFSGNQIILEYPLIMINSLMPNEFQDLNLNFIAPEIPGIYTTQLRMYSPSGTWFGDIIWLIIKVQKLEELSILSNQMSNMNLALNNHQMNNASKSSKIDPHSMQSDSTSLQ